MEPKTLRPAFSFGAGGYRWQAKGAQECGPFRMLVDLATARGAPLIDSTSSRIGVRMSFALTAWRRSPLLKEPKMSERLEMLNKARARMIEHVNTTYLETVVRDELAGTFFTMNLDSARASLAKVPWVRSISLRRCRPARYPSRGKKELGAPFPAKIRTRI